MVASGVTTLKVHRIEKVHVWNLALDVVKAEISADTLHISFLNHWTSNNDYSYDNNAQYVV